jgi:hypothetical protein
VAALPRNAFYGCQSLSEVRFPGMKKTAVAENALDWQLGINTMYEKAQTIIVYCKDGVLVLNSASESSDCD